MSDYYRVLRLPRTATAGQIRQAFRRLAFECHPDRAGNHSWASERFQRIREAYEHLSDPQRRARYDAELAACSTSRPVFTAREDFAQANARPTAASGTVRSSGRAFFSGHASRSRRGERRTGRCAAERASASAGKNGEFLYEANICSARDYAATTFADIRATLDVSLEESLIASRYGVNVEDSRAGRGQSQRYTVRIPGKLWDGCTLRVSGLGGYHPIENRSGSLYIRVQLREHPFFTVREGGHVACETYLYPWEARRGIVVALPTLEGQATLRVPPKASDGLLMRLAGHGLYTPFGRRGDLYVRVRHSLESERCERHPRIWNEQRHRTAV